MPLVTPLVSKSFARQVIVILPDAPAASTGIPTVAEVNAGVFASLHLYNPFRFTPTQNTGEGPRKVGQRFAPTELGQTNYPALEAQYSYLPQEVGTAGADGNEVYEALVPDSTVTIVTLDGVDGETSAVTASQIADVFLVQCGIRRKGSTGDGEFDHNSVTQSLIVQGGEPLAEDHALAAS